MISVKVFLPVGVCGCSLVEFLAPIYNAIRKYDDILEYAEYPAIGEEAKKFHIEQRGVVVGSILLGSSPTSASIEEAILAEARKQSITVS